MKSELTKIALLVVALTSLPFAAQAQSDVAMRVDVVGWGDSISGLTLRAAAGVPFTAQAFRYSRPQAYSGPAVMEIYQAAGEAMPSAAPTEEEAAKLPPLLKELLVRRKKNPTLVALAALPSDSNRATVLLSPIRGGLFLSYVIDDDPSKLPVGQLRVHNLSPHPLALRVGGKDNHLLAVQGSCLVAPVKQEVIYELAYQKDDEWVVLENNLAPVAEDEQTQMVVLKSDSDFFTSSNGSRSGYLQIVFLRRLPREQQALEFTKAEREAASKEVARREAEMDEAAKPGAKKPAPGGNDKAKPRSGQKPSKP